MPLLAATASVEQEHSSGTVQFETPMRDVVHSAFLSLLRTGVGLSSRGQIHQSELCSAFEAGCRPHKTELYVHYDKEWRNGLTKNSLRFHSYWISTELPHWLLCTSAELQERIHRMLLDAFTPYDLYGYTNHFEYNPDKEQNFALSGLQLYSTGLVAALSDNNQTYLVNWVKVHGHDLVDWISDGGVRSVLRTGAATVVRDKLMEMLEREVLPTRCQMHDESGDTWLDDGEREDLSNLDSVDEYMMSLLRGEAVNDWIRQAPQV